MDKLVNCFAINRVWYSVGRWCLSKFSTTFMPPPPPLIFNICTWWKLIAAAHLNVGKIDIFSISLHELKRFNLVLLYWWKAIDILDGRRFRNIDTRHLGSGSCEVKWDSCRLLLGTPELRVLCCSNCWCWQWGKLLQVIICSLTHQMLLLLV